MTEAELLEKLARIEALFAGTTFEGERNAAANARDKLRARIAELIASDPPREHQFSLRDIWSVKLTRRCGHADAREPSEAPKPLPPGK